MYLKNSADRRTGFPHRKHGETLINYIIMTKISCNSKIRDSLQDSCCNSIHCAELIYKEHDWSTSTQGMSCLLRAAKCRHAWPTARWRQTTAPQGALWSHPSDHRGEGNAEYWLVICYHVVSTIQSALRIDFTMVAWGATRKCPSCHQNHKWGGLITAVVREQLSSQRVAIGVYAITKGMPQKWTLHRLRRAGRDRRVMLQTWGIRRHADYASTSSLVPTTTTDN